MDVHLLCIKSADLFKKISKDFFIAFVAILDSIVVRLFLIKCDVLHADALAPSDAR